MFESNSRTVVLRVVIINIHSVPGQVTTLVGITSHSRHFRKFLWITAEHSLRVRPKHEHIWFYLLSICNENNSWTTKDQSRKRGANCTDVIVYIFLIHAYDLTHRRYHRMHKLNLNVERVGQFEQFGRLADWLIYYTLSNILRLLRCFRAFIL